MSTVRAQKRTFVLLTALCTVADFVSYISRINLGAAMIEIVAPGFAEKTPGRSENPGQPVAAGGESFRNGDLVSRSPAQRICSGRGKKRSYPFFCRKRVIFAFKSL